MTLAHVAAALRDQIKGAVESRTRRIRATVTEAFGTKHFGVTPCPLVVIGAVDVEQHPLAFREAAAAPLELLLRASADRGEERIEAPNLLRKPGGVRIIAGD